MANVFDQFDAPQSGGNVFDQFDANTQPSVAADVAKSAGIGAVKGAIGVAGSLGDFGHLLGDLRDRYVANPINRSLGLQEIDLNKPDPALKIGSQAIQSGIEDQTGKFYEPKTLPGQYAQTAGEFLPGLIGGPEGIVAKLLGRVVAPAVASETAGQLTKGTDAEPYARVIGALAGGGAAAKASNSLSQSRALKAATPSADAIKSEASSAYDALTSRNIALPISQGTLDTLADDITKTLNNKGIRPSTARAIHDAVDEIRTPANQLGGVTPGNPAYARGLPDVADLVAARQNVKSLLGAPDANKAGAAIALQKIETEIERQSPNTMAKIQEADKNWSAYKANEALDKRLARADLRAAGEHSGMNIGNRIRQQVTNYLMSRESRYLSSETRADLEKIVKGSMSQNAIRQVANLLGGGGGLGMLAGGTAGYEAGGWPGALAGAAAGRAFKLANNRAVVRDAERAAEAIRRRSPLGQQISSPTMLSPILPGVTVPNPSHVPLPLKSNVALNALIPALVANQTAGYPLPPTYKR